MIYYSLKTLNINDAAVHSCLCDESATKEITICFVPYDKMPINKNASQLGMHLTVYFWACMQLSMHVDHKCKPLKSITDTVIFMD